MDADCASDVCDFSSGSCKTSGILYVSASGDAASACNQATPCTLDHALTLVNTTNNYIRMKPEAYSIDTTISEKVTIDGYGATIGYPSATATINVPAGADVTLLGMTIQKNTAGQAISCDGGSDSRSLHLIDVTVTVSDYAVIANPCLVTIERSRLKATASQPILLGLGSTTQLNITRSTIDGGGGVIAGGAAYATVFNSVFVNQTSANGAIIGANSFGSTRGVANVAFSTFVNARLICESGPPSCASASGGNGVCISDSIIVGPASGDAIQGGCIVNDSIIKQQAAAVSGSGNRVNVDPLFISANDYSLQSTSPAVDAVPDTTIAPATDLLGTKRPQGPHSDLGAYELKK